MSPKRTPALVSFRNLLSALKRVGEKRAPKRRSTGGVRIYAVGDIHGRADLLRALLELIIADAGAAPAARKLLIYLGDYVDRGSDSREVIELLLEGPPPGFDAIYLKGNHEEALLRFLDSPDFGHEWRHFGGLETLESYGVTDLGARLAHEGFDQARDQFAARLPDSHREFLQGLELRACLGDYLFVHAGVRPGVSLEDQREEDLLWIRDDFTHWRGGFSKVVVHGHSVVEEPEFGPHRINVDTGAYMTNHLTCAVLEGAEQAYLQTGGAPAPKQAPGISGAT